MATIRDQIMIAMKTRLETILISNGYETDLGGSITEWRTDDIQESEVITGNITDASEDTAPRGFNDENTLPVEIEIKTTGVTMITTMRSALGDVVKAIGTDPTISSLVQNMSRGSNTSVGVDQKSRKYCSSVISYEMKYLTKRFNPFELA
jgi:hypothetical protein